MKDEAVERLAHAHYRIDPTLTVVRRLLAPAELEADPDEPVKLLEVNESATADGIIPVHFNPNPAAGIVYASLIVEITPEEYKQILLEPQMLPNGWKLGNVVERGVVVG